MEEIVAVARMVFTVQQVVRGILGRNQGHSSGADLSASWNTSSMWTVPRVTKEIVEVVAEVPVPQFQE